jgi:hypothetical protein
MADTLLSCSGGKAGAPTIQTDHQFGVVVEALASAKKILSISVAFDIDAMDGFRISQPVSIDQPRVGPLH